MAQYLTTQAAENTTHSIRAPSLAQLTTPSDATWPLHPNGFTASICRGEPGYHINVRRR